MSVNFTIDTLHLIMKMSPKFLVDKTSIQP